MRPWKTSNAEVIPMNATTVKEAKKNLDRLIRQVNVDAEPIIICSDQGQKVVLSLEEFNPTATLDLALSLTPLFVRKIRAVIAPLDPGHAGEDCLNCSCAQGQDDRQHSPQLGPGEGRRVFSPRGFSGARESKAPASSSAYGGATRDIAALHHGPSPVRVSLLRSIAPRPTAPC